MTHFKRLPFHPLIGDSIREDQGMTCLHARGLEGGRAVCYLVTMGMFTGNYGHAMAAPLTSGTYWLWGRS